MKHQKNKDLTIEELEVFRRKMQEELQSTEGAWVGEELANKMKPFVEEDK